MPCIAGVFLGLQRICLSLLQFRLEAGACLPRAMGDALNQDLSRRARFSLSQLALAASLALSANAAHALGLGRLNVQSALGETLRAEIELTSLSPEEAASLRVRVASPDVYRSNGLDYNVVLSGTQVQLSKRGDGRSVLRIVSDRAVQEPFVDVVLDISWSTGRLTREYTLLFDPPNRVARAPEPAPVAPVVSAPAPQAPAPAQVAKPVATPDRVPSTGPGAPVRAPAPSANEGTVVVGRGDSLSRIAARNRPDGVSLDQMLVALYRGNPDAFLNNNMNLLRAGARLKVPGAEAGNVGASEARQLVKAHSADFDSARQGLASAAPKLPAEPERAAKGAVQAQVQDTKPASPTGDRLTLSKPVPATPAPVAPASKPADNVAALTRNVQDLQKLAEAAKPATAVASAPASVPPISLPASLPTAASSVASAPPVVASKPIVASKPAPAPAPVAEAEGGVLGWLMSPVGAILGAGLLAALGVFGWRAMRKPKTDEGRETMFGESRLQPDSFFGVTGGQRVDTRDGASGVSSMSYSLSQLDAHGDVDPVAEADVYLAYGRDLQAEEILKEALRSQPERTAIRLKLLEVYARRRDVRGFEQLALQLYAECKGEGEDWLKAQEMGRGIDAENPLYQPGGAPRSMFDDEAPRPEPMDASTLPAAVTALAGAATETFANQPELSVDSSLDLDLDLGSPEPAPAPAKSPELTMPMAPAASSAGNDLEFKLDDLEFEASTESPSTVGEPLENAQQRARVGGDSLIDAVQDLANDDGDPLTRQLELAEEFRQIGDVEGARDVLQELINQVDSGPLYEKAKALLDSLR
jgi:pilus assembly protein FimV